MLDDRGSWGMDKSSELRAAHEAKRRRDLRQTREMTTVVEYFCGSLELFYAKPGGKSPRCWGRDVQNQMSGFGALGPPHEPYCRDFCRDSCAKVVCTRESDNAYGWEQKIYATFTGPNMRGYAGAQIQNLSRCVVHHIFKEQPAAVSYRGLQDLRRRDLTEGPRLLCSARCPAVRAEREGGSRVEWQHMMGQDSTSGSRPQRQIRVTSHFGNSLYVALVVSGCLDLCSSLTGIPFTSLGY